MAGTHATAVGEAALAVLAERGGRGFTHRAVDERAGLPEGTASRYARTRTALFDLAADELFRADTADAATALTPEGSPPADRAELVDALVRTVTRLGATPTHYRARLELQLEAARRTHLRQHFRHGRAAFVAETAGHLERLGCTDAVRHADGIVTLLDGLLFRQLVAGADPVDDRQLRSLVGQMVVGC